MTTGSGPPDFEPPVSRPPDSGRPDSGPPDFVPPDFVPPDFVRSGFDSTGFDSTGVDSAGVGSAGVASAGVEPATPPGPVHHIPGQPGLPVRPAGPGRQALVIVLVALATVLVVLVAADRIAPRLVGDRVAGTLQKELGSDRRPVVRFGGFPFLTQVATRRYQKITITARDVPVSGTGGRLLVSEFDGTLTRVHPNWSYRTITVGHFTGSARIGYASLTRFVGTTVAYDSSGASGPGFVTMTLGGEITMTGKPALDVQANQLYLIDTQFRIAGRPLPGAPPNALTDQLFRFPLPEMLGGAQLSGVRARPNGLVLTGSGDDLTLRR